MAGKPSVTEPISQAWDWTRQVLFCDADMGKWFIMGFCAFLAGLGESGGVNFNFPFGNNNIKNPGAQQMMAWVKEHLMLIAAGIAGLVIIGLIFMAIMKWLSSRGKFMFIDGIIHNRAEVTEPWHRFKDLGNNLFMFQFSFTIVSSILSLGLIALCGVIAWPDFQAGRFGASASLALLIGAMIGVPLLFTVMTVVLVIDDFVVPIMYYRQARIMQAWKIFWRDVVTGNAWPLTLFYTVKMVLGMGAAMIMFFGTCITCCIAGLPYLSSVVFLPVLMFMRCYSLFFLEQLGDQWRMHQEPDNPVADQDAMLEINDDEPAAPEADQSYTRQEKHYDDF